MRGHSIYKALRVTALAVLLIAAVGFAVMELWNGLMPHLFAWPPLSYLQALGVLILSRILFGGFRGHRGPVWHGRRGMLEGWHETTAEERQLFHRHLRGRA